MSGYIDQISINGVNKNIISVERPVFSDYTTDINTTDMLPSSTFFDGFGYGKTNNAKYYLMKNSIPVSDVGVYLITFNISAKKKTSSKETRLYYGIIGGADETPNNEWVRVSMGQNVYNYSATYISLQGSFVYNNSDSDNFGTKTTITDTANASAVTINYLNFATGYDGATHAADGLNVQVLFFPDKSAK